MSSALVIGAGLAGLSAAYRLQQAGWAVTVIERGSYAGGRAASRRQGNYLIDTGATGVGDCYTHYMALIDELGMSDQMVESSQISATLRDGKIFEVDGKHPFLSGALSGLFSWRSKLLMNRLFRDLKAMGNTLSFEDVSLGWEVDCESAADYAKRRLNQELLDYFVDPILRALVVARASEVSRLELMNALNGLFSTTLVAPLGGMRALPAALAQRLNIHYRCEALSLDTSGTGLALRYRERGSGEEKTLTADRAVLATLLPQSVAIYPPCRQWVAPLSDNIHYIPGICVHLGFSARTRSKALMLLLGEKEIPDITLIWLEHNKAPDRAPDGHSLFYLYYDDAVAQRVAAQSNDELIAQCTALIEGLYPEVAGRCDMATVTRWDAAVPKPAPGYFKRMRQVREALDNDNHGPVQLAGDYLSCVGQNTAIHYGNEAARKLLSS